MRYRPVVRALGLWAVLVAAAVPAFAAPETRDERRTRNCAYYREMVARALSGMENAALSPAFSRQHDLFVAGGCLATKAACPGTAADYAFADLLTILTVSANMGSTFTPFRCPVSGE